MDQGACSSSLIISLYQDSDGSGIGLFEGHSASIYFWQGISFLQKEFKKWGLFKFENV
jgi:hypothetical protein